jgi:hypothetical protein
MNATEKEEVITLIHQREQIRDLNTKLLKIKTQQHYEEALRSQFPALQDAWEQYQTLLKLAGK